jgi:hypothetical protein
VSAGKYQFVCWTNVSCVTDNFFLFIQAASVKAFPPLFTPAGLLAGFFPENAIRGAMPSGRLSASFKHCWHCALGKRFGRF